MDKFSLMVRKLKSPLNTNMLVLWYLLKLEIFLVKAKII